jgi:hypothetical protein
MTEMTHRFKFLTFAAVAAIIVLNANVAFASEVEITIDGFISLGSSAGMIYDSEHDYSYAGNTRNLDVLHKGCPIQMGDEVPCKVRFKADGRSVTEIVSAAAPTFGGVAIDKPGGVFDASVCDQKNKVDYAVHFGCSHFDDLTVQVLAINGDIAKLRWNGQLKYALSQRVTINCHGTSISLASYIGKNFPPGMKGC